MTKNIISIVAVLLVAAAASTGIVLAKQYQADNYLKPSLAVADIGNPPPNCPCQQAGLDCHCTDNGQPCNCANQCGCQSGCHKTQGQSPTTE